jgi:hypothetical protein
MSIRAGVRAGKGSGPVAHGRRSPQVARQLCRKKATWQSDERCAIQLAAHHGSTLHSSDSSSMPLSANCRDSAAARILCGRARRRVGTPEAAPWDHHLSLRPGHPSLRCSRNRRTVPRVAIQRAVKSAACGCTHFRHSSACVKWPQPHFPFQRISVPAGTDQAPFHSGAIPIKRHSNQAPFRSSVIPIKLIPIKRHSDQTIVHPKR